MAPAEAEILFSITGELLYLFHGYHIYPIPDASFNRKISSNDLEKLEIIDKQELMNKVGRMTVRLPLVSAR